VAQEKPATYNPDLYLTPNKEVNRAYAPSKLLKLDKTTHFEGWLLHMADPSSGEWRVGSGQ